MACSSASLAITLTGAFFSNRASTSTHIVRIFLNEFQRILPKTLKGMVLRGDEVCEAPFVVAHSIMHSQFISVLKNGH